MGRGWENFEGHAKKKKRLEFINTLLAEIWLKALLVKAQNEVKSMTEKAYIILDQFFK